MNTDSGLLQRFALWALRRCGWRVTFTSLPGPRGVIIVYPHTSNWDFLFGLLAKWAIGIHVHWLGKESLFRGPCGFLFGALLRAWGGEPIERGAASGAIERLTRCITAADHYWLALAPEGTRRYRSAWRSGFYHIALGAGIPLGLARIDYRTREIRLTDFILPSGDSDMDLAHIRAVYAGCQGRKPEWAAPIELESPPRAAGKEKSAA